MRQEAWLSSAEAGTVIPDEYGVVFDALDDATSGDGQLTREELRALFVTIRGLEDVGSHSSPAFVDLDGDGDLDVVSGEETGNLLYHENLARVSRPVMAETERIVVPISKNGGPTSFALNLNALEPADHELTWHVRFAAGDGAALASGTGSLKAITYMPNTDFVGNNVFIVEVANEHGRVDSTTIVVRVFDPTNAIPLRDNFVALDTDASNGLTLAKAQAQLPGLTQLEFDALDKNGNGELTLNELLNATIGTGGITPVYVNFSNNSPEDGTSPATGFNTLLEGTSFVTENGTVIISGENSPESIYIPIDMTLQSGGGTVKIGHSP